MQKLLSDKKIALGITGSVAAYKAAELTHLLSKECAQIKVIMTAGGEKFITPLTLQALSNNPVYTDLFRTHHPNGMDHIDLAKWVDLILIAPASANFIARLANGYADDLLKTVCLASNAPIAIAPAMNIQMWQNSATQENVITLRERGVSFLGPVAGLQACGDDGEGRMMEPQDLLNEVKHFFNEQVFKGYNVLVTAGPTQEPFDPVRFLTNKSSGKMGFAIAQAAAEAGAHVTLVSGPTNIPFPNNVKTVSVTSAQEMFDAVMQYASEVSIFIATAAVCDYRPSNYSQTKIKKGSETKSMSFEKNPDILATVAKLSNAPFTIGFCAETESLIKNATKKLKEKNLDMIVANEVGPNKGFQADHNKVTIIKKDGQIVELSLSHKLSLARKLISIISASLERALNIV